MDINGAVALVTGGASGLGLATTEMATAVQNGVNGYVDTDPERLVTHLQRLLRDVTDHVIQVVERADAFRMLLQNALTVHSTLVAQQQNDEMRALTETSLNQNEEVKRISSWAAIFFAPTLVGTVYGMNFEHMPELAWRYGYPLAVLAMVGLGLLLYLLFRRNHWL